VKIVIERMKIANLTNKRH